MPLIVTVVQNYGERLMPNALASANVQDGAEDTIPRCLAFLDDATPAVLGPPSIHTTWPTPMLEPTAEAPHVPGVCSSRSLVVIAASNRTFAWLLAGDIIALPEPALTADCRLCWHSIVLHQADASVRNGSNMVRLEEIARHELNGYFDTIAKHDRLKRCGHCPLRGFDANALKPGGAVAKVVSKRLKAMFESATQANNNKRRKLTRVVIPTAIVVPLGAERPFNLSGKGQACHSMYWAP